MFRTVRDAFLCAKCNARPNALETKSRTYSYTPYEIRQPDELQDGKEITARIKRKAR